MSEQTEITHATPQDEMERLRAGRRLRPAVDIYDSADEILLVADVPGVKSDAVTVSFDKGELTIEAHRDLPVRRDEEPTPLIYTRTFRVPEGIEADKIAASLKNGVLEVHLPRREELKPRRVTVLAG